jgi:hypothetical protein
MPTETICEPVSSVKDDVASERFAGKVGSTALSIWGTIGGLVIAAIAGVTFIIVLSRKKRTNEAVDQEDSDMRIDIVETMTSFRGSDHYVSQDGFSGDRDGNRKTDDILDPECLAAEG